MTTVTFEPGVFDMPEDSYHRDPVPGGSLSHSGAKLLLPPSCPAIFHYERQHPPEPTKAMELGIAVHSLVLGTGQEISVIDAQDWRTKAAKDGAGHARDMGRLPLLRAEYARAQAIADALARHETAGPLFWEGKAEASGFWQDPEFGVWRRCRWDWLTHFGGQLVQVDLKTCASASPDAIRKAIHDRGYYQQDPYYTDGAAALGLDDDPDFLFVFVQTTPPYPVTVARLEPEAREAGRQRNRLAIERFRDCTEAGVWPAWSDDIVPVGLPTWAERRIESELTSDY